MATEKILLGHNAVLTVDGAEVEDATDVTITLSKGSVNTTTRKTNGWTSKAPGFKDLAIEFTMLVREESTVGAALMTAFRDDTIVEVTALDQADGEGPSGDFYVQEMTRGEPMGEGINYKCKLEWTSDG